MPVRFVPPVPSDRMIQTEILQTPECPHAEAATELVSTVAADLDVPIGVETTAIDSQETAAETGMLGSPTILVAGRDLEAPELSDDRTPAVACRLYDGEGTPPRWMVETALLRSLGGDHLLFLCVANSARSQIAEGIARDLVDRANLEVRISSAGSDPGRMRDGAVAVLDEIGIDPSDQFSKGLDTIDTETVDTVVTLCAEEACPAYLGDARRLHWALPDPAGVEKGDDGLDAFREVRDALRRRLGHLFG